MSEQKTNGAHDPGVLTGPNGRHKYSQAFQDAVALRYLKGEPAATFLKELKVHPSMVYRWTKSYQARHKSAPKKSNGKKSRELPKRVKGLSKSVKVSKGIPGGEVDPVKIRAGIGYLKHAKTAMYEALAKGAITELDEAHLLMLSALNVFLS